jgi:sialate O-acetylesterase
VEGDKIRISFDHIGTGLITAKKKGLAPVKETPDEKLKWVAIAGEDKKWYWADAVIDGNTVLVSSAKVRKPVAVRYAFAMNPEGANLYNKEGFPASPFRTDNW